MIKPEQIPDEAVDAMLESIGSFFCRAEARAACAAALNAWPGGEVVDWYHADKTLILPLTQEDS